MVMDSSFEACDFVLFGTKGDLSRRKLLPSLYQLEKAGLLHPDTTIVGVARQELTRHVRDLIRPVPRPRIDRRKGGVTLSIG